MSVIRSTHVGRLMRGRSGRQVRGFVIYLVLGLLAFLVLLALFVLRDLRHRDVWTHRYSSGEIALNLARAGLANMLFSLRQSLAPCQIEPQNLARAPLYAFLLQDCEAIERAVEQGRSAGGDDSALVRQLLGDGAMEPTIRLLSRYRGSRLTLWVRFDARPLHGDGSKPGDVTRRYSDPVEKEISLRVVSTAEVDTALRTVWSEKAIRVYDLLLPVTPRFTAFARASAKGSAAINDLACDASGRPSQPGDPGPTVLYHDNPKMAPALKLPQPHQPGWLCMGDDPVVFKLTAGGLPAGEDFHLCSTGEKPQGRTVDHAPQTLTSARPNDPGHPGEQQAPMLQAACWGYHDGMDPLLLFSRPDFTELSSRLHLFGTAAVPSPTRVYGMATQGLALYSDLAIDRDATGKDEADQKASCGLELKQRESIDPFLRTVTAAQFDEDAAREQAGDPPQNLVPFSSPGQSPYRVENRNALIDADGDGVAETVVPSEIGREILSLDPVEYRYSKLFGEYATYDAWSSREVRLAANAIPELMQKSPDDAFLMLATAFLPRSAAIGLDDHILESREMLLPYTDPLHEAVTPDGSKRWHFSGQAEPGEDLRAFSPEAIVGNRVCWQMPAEEFVARFVRKQAAGGATLDLGGRALAVDGTIELPAGTRVVSPGLVQAGGVRLHGDFLQGESFAPVSLSAGSVEFKDATTVQAALWAGSAGAPKGLILAGSLATPQVPELAALRGCTVVYDGRFDPTGPDAHLYYREAMSDRELDAGVMHGSGKGLVEP